MTQEEKQLLLKDLCARLPYGVKAHTKLGTNITIIGVIDDTIKDETEDSFDVSFIKPYLRPMSSMTEEEKKWYHLYGTGSTSCTASCAELVIDWLNEHHFDYRMLIEIGLALEAPEGMYKNE